MLSLLGMGPSGEEHKPTYANGMNIVANMAEVRLQFYQRNPDGSVHTAPEVILPPIIAKALTRLLMENLREWEKDNHNLYLPEDNEEMKQLFGEQFAGESPETEEPEDDDGGDESEV